MAVVPGPAKQLSMKEILGDIAFGSLLPMCYLKTSMKIISYHNLLISLMELRGIEPRTS